MMERNLIGFGRSKLTEAQGEYRYGAVRGSCKHYVAEHITDLYVPQRTKTAWSKAKSMGSVLNSKDEESSLRFSRDGKYFFFSRAENLGGYE
jgi:hypothetical protein